MKKKNLLMTAIAIFGLATITTAQVPNYIPTNGLIGWWPFNGNANDESGNGNNGTVNGATLTNDRFSNLNSAFQFNRSSAQSIDITNSPALNNITQLTLSIWYNIQSYNDPSSCCGYNHFINKSDQSNQNQFVFAGNNTGLYFYYDNTNAFQTSTLTPLNQWNNVVLVYEYNGGPSSMCKFYLNGILTDSFPTNAQLVSTNFNLRFGTYGSYSYNTVDGIIDDIGIWNRPLTQQEITDLYNGCQLAVNNHPTNQTININNNAQFVVGSSDPSASYQWQTDFGVGFQNLNSVGQYSGTTNDTLTVSNVTMSNNNQPFRCIVSSGSCSDTSNVAVLTVNNNVGINETSQDNLFSVFPNPAQSVINVKADSKLIGSVYSIYDNTGRVVLSGKLNTESTTIELGNLSGGIYMFSIGENMKQTFKVIKE